jgi:hypothetical protein
MMSILDLLLSRLRLQGYVANGAGRVQLRRRFDGTARGLPVIDLKGQSPSRIQALAPRVFHPDMHVPAASVFDLKHRALDQASAARIFHLNRHAHEQARAAGVIDFDRRDFASGRFHLNHHPIGRAHACERRFSRLR